MKTYKRVLTIAGSDSGGGAGIQADIKTISACGCYAMSAITAITVQNTIHVQDVFPIPVSVIKGEIEAVVSDIGVDSVKIGMLHSSEVIRTILETLQKYNLTNIVLDPVMVAKSGDTLLQSEAISTLKNELVPYARVITPNIPEAEIFLGKKIKSQDDLPDMARELSQGRRTSVFLKAGHLSDDNLIDIFYNAETDEILELTSKRQFTQNTHGTGCTLSSAFASFIALGNTLNDSARKAKEYISAATEAGKEYKIGHGHGPVCHFYKWW